MLCGNCNRCPVFEAWCGGCPGCGVLLLRKNLCIKKGGCGACPYLCPDRPGVWAEKFEETGRTFSFLEGWPGGRRLNPNLPTYVPLITAPLQEKVPEDLRGFWFAVHGGKISQAVWLGEIGVREQFRLPRETKTALHLFVKDGVLEFFWRERRKRMPVLAQFDAVFAPNFSVYEDAPRFEHLYNMRRSAVCAAEMAAAGVPVVPDVSWYRREDLDRWSEFVWKTEIRTVAFSFQVVGRALKNRPVWLSYLLGFRYLCSVLPPGVRIAVVGVASPSRAREIVRAAKGRPLTFVDTRVFVSARKGSIAVCGKKMPPPGLSRDAVFFASIRENSHFFEEMLFGRG